SRSSHGLRFFYSPPVRFGSTAGCSRTKRACRRCSGGLTSIIRGGGSAGSQASCEGSGALESCPVRMVSVRASPRSVRYRTHPLKQGASHLNSTYCNQNGRAAFLIASSLQKGTSKRVRHEQLPRRVSQTFGAEVGASHRPDCHGRRPRDAAARP